jgi:hypothetical protein
MPSEPTRVALLVTDTLERLSITYAVEGSLADLDYGVARSALGANIIADMRSEHVAPFVTALSGDFYADPRSIEAAIERRERFSLVHYATKYNLDIFIPRLTPFDQMLLTRRRASIISSHPPRQVSVASPEDAILSTLERFRTSGTTMEQSPWSERQLVKEVAARLRAEAGKLDLDYLRFWGRELNLADLLERALTQV